jgi:hypothetical protein
MLADASPADNLRRLHWLLSRATGYFGVTNYMGAKFSASKAPLSPVLSEIADRGVAYVDDGSSPRSAAAQVAANIDLPFASGDVVIDAGQTVESIEASLRRLEAIANERGAALGVATALPATMRIIQQWSSGLAARDIELVPVSSLLKQTRPRS